MSGVTDLSKINCLACIGCILGMIHHGGLFAESVASGYTYQPVTPNADFYSGYRWRPAESSNPQAGSEGGSFRGGLELAPDGLRSPMGAPPDAYRPIQETHTLYPQVGTFRFRSISPEEQSRIQGSDRSPSDIKPDRYHGRLKYRDDDKLPFRAPHTDDKFRFRPDARFPSSQSRETNWESTPGPTQAYPPVYTTPVFRKKNRER